MLIPDGPAGRRASTRAIAMIAGRDSTRAYKTELWFAIHHAGIGEVMRMLRIERTA